MTFEDYLCILRNITSPTPYGAEIYVRHHDNAKMILCISRKIEFIIDPGANWIVIRSYVDGVGNRHIEDTLYRIVNLSKLMNDDSYVFNDSIPETLRPTQKQACEMMIHYKRILHLGIIHGIGFDR